MTVKSMLFIIFIIYSIEFKRCFWISISFLIEIASSDTVGTYFYIVKIVINTVLDILLEFGIDAGWSGERRFAH